jgi:cytochrome c553
VRDARLLAVALVAAAWLCAEAASRRSDAQPVEEAQPVEDSQRSDDTRPGAASPEHEVPLPDPGASLPNEPTKALVFAYCNHCHGLEWIERSGADLEGWTSRLRRMNRAGAMIPEEQIAPLADYLARALPERPRPPEPPKKREARASKRH